MATLSERLRTISAMIHLGEKISWGSETALMDEAADALDAMEAALEFYADPFDYIKRHNLDEFVPDFYDEMDTCARAVAALAMVRK